MAGCRGRWAARALSGVLRPDKAFFSDIFGDGQVCEKVNSLAESNVHNFGKCCSLLLEINNSELFDIMRLHFLWKPY